VLTDDAIDVASLATDASASRIAFTWSITSDANQSQLAHIHAEVLGKAASEATAVCRVARHEIAA
jgi:hypothetical protein